MVFKDVTFKVQIAASSRKLMPKPYNFKGLDTISRQLEGKLYKYYYGNTSNYNTAKKLMENAKAKGYNSSFIVAFKNGKKQLLAEVLKSNSN
jgi:N-acetylmuramoyl-L-alanine amidase